MSRELAKVGDVEPLVFEWELNDGEYPTGAEVRAYVEEAGTRKFWNGTAFTTTDAQLSPVVAFALGVWKGQFTYPAVAAGKEVFFEARPTGHADLAKQVLVDSRRVVNELPDGSESTMDVDFVGA